MIELPSEMSREVGTMKPFIVRLWSGAFSLLRELTPLRIIRIRIIPRIKPDFRQDNTLNDALIEAWAFGHFLLSMLALAVCSALSRHWCEYIAIVWGVVRVWEIVIVQINVLLFDWYKWYSAKKRDRDYALVGYLRMVILLVHNYAEIIFWFAIIYLNRNWSAQKDTLSLFLESLNLSFVTMTTFGQTEVSPPGNLGKALTLIQSVIGLFMSLAVLARFISLLPEPKTLDKYEQPLDHDLAV